MSEKVIRKKLIKWVSIVASVCLLLVLAGSFTLAAEKKLTPKEFNQLTMEEKIKYKTVVIKPRGFWGFFDAKPVKKDYLEKMLLTASLSPWILYSQNLFCLEHPEVRIEKGVLSWDPKNIAAALAAGTMRNPFCFNVGGGLDAWKDMGVLADITDLVKNWDQNEYLWENYPTIWGTFWREGRCYGVPAPAHEAYCINFRKDWFKEAGIFNIVQE